MEQDKRAKCPKAVRLFISISFLFIVSAIALGYYGLLSPQMLLLMLGLSWIGLIIGAALWIIFGTTLWIIRGRVCECEACSQVRHLQNTQVWHYQNIKEALKYSYHEICSECNGKAANTKSIHYSEENLSQAGKALREL